LVYPYKFDFLWRLRHFAQVWRKLWWQTVKSGGSTFELLPSHSPNNLRESGGCKRVKFLQSHICRISFYTLYALRLFTNKLKANLLWHLLLLFSPNSSVRSANELKYTAFSVGICRKNRIFFLKIDIFL